MACERQNAAMRSKFYERLEAFCEHNWEKIRSRHGHAWARVDVECYGIYQGSKSEIENPKERPVQETENPQNTITETTVTNEAGGKEARQPKQASSEAEKFVCWCQQVGKHEKNERIKKSEEQYFGHVCLGRWIYEGSASTGERRAESEKDELRDHP